VIPGEARNAASGPERPKKRRQSDMVDIDGSLTEGALASVGSDVGYDEYRPEA
jgi:hypothetical protein